MWWFSGPFFIALGLILAPIAHADDGSGEEALQCGNGRYEDFMHLQYQKDKADNARPRDIDAVKELRKDDARRIEAARKTYRREAKPDDSAAEARWLAQQKGEKEQAEMIRRRYVQRRDESLRTRCQSLKIPELKEFELEDY